MFSDITLIASGVQWSLNGQENIYTFPKSTLCSSLHPYIRIQGWRLMNIKYMLNLYYLSMNMMKYYLSMNMMKWYL